MILLWLYLHEHTITLDKSERDWQSKRREFTSGKEEQENWDCLWIQKAGEAKYTCYLVMVGDTSNYISNTKTKLFCVIGCIEYNTEYFSFAPC